jgi:hypothetical protein
MNDFRAKRNLFFKGRFVFHLNQAYGALRTEKPLGGSGTGT